MDLLQKLAKIVQTKPVNWDFNKLLPNIRILKLNQSSIIFSWIVTSRDKGDIYPVFKDHNVTLTQQLNEQ